MSFLRKYAAKKKEEFMSHVSDEIKALVGSGQVITLSEFDLVPIGIDREVDGWKLVPDFSEVEKGAGGLW